MCLQNYFIFYLEVIPPLSSFIALYMTEVGEQPPMRPSQLWTERVFMAQLWRGSKAPESLCSGPSSPPWGSSVGLETATSLPGLFLYCLSQSEFYCIAKGKGGAFLRSCDFWEGCNAALAKPGALTPPGPRLQLSVSSSGPCSLSSRSLTFKGQKEPWFIKLSLEMGVGRTERLIFAGECGGSHTLVCIRITWSAHWAAEPGPQPQRLWFCRAGMGPEISVFPSCQMMLTLWFHEPHFENHWARETRGLRRGFVCVYV